MPSGICGTNGPYSSPAAPVDLTHCCRQAPVCDESAFVRLCDVCSDARLCRPAHSAPHGVISSSLHDSDGVHGDARMVCGVCCDEARVALTQGQTQRSGASGALARTRRGGVSAFACARRNVRRHSASGVHA